MTDHGSFGGVLRDALTIAQKDLRTEVRNKEILVTMGFFGFIVVLIAAFAFFRGSAPIAAVGAGTLWVAIAFSGTLGLSRAFDRERDGDAIKALLLSPVARPAIYLGKLLGIVIFMTLTELVIVPAVAIFFSIDITAERVGPLLAILLLGTIGYAVVGTVLSASLMRAKSRDVLLAIAVYPFVIPVLIAGVKASAALLGPEIAMAEVHVWLRVLAAYDVIFLVASLWIFEALIMD